MNITDNTRSRWCCMRRCLETEDDFQKEQPLIQIKIEEAGHICLFLPKFHRELNPIERYWGWGKQEFRERCNGTLAHAKEILPQCLDSCPVNTIQHFFRKSWRYMDAYR
jgi:hypothetical protein